MKADSCSRKAEKEISHGRKLTAVDPESVWGWSSPAGRRRAERRAEMIRRGARLSPETKALEIGCGTGLFTEKFAAGGSKLVAMDISPGLLALARKRALDPEQVRFVEARFEASEPGGPFGAVIGSSVLHHLDLKTALEHIMRLLEPGGRLSFAEPNMMNPQIFVERRFRFLFPGVSPDETAFTRFKMKRDLEKAGFINIEIKPFDWLHPAVPESCIPLVSRLGYIMEKTPLLREFAGSLLISAQRPER